MSSTDISTFKLTKIHFRLVSGPGLATEGHIKDANVVVRAQVSIRPLRSPSGMQQGMDDNDDEKGIVLVLLKIRIA
jgi:hypothetical protein